MVEKKLDNEIFSHYDLLSCSEKEFFSDNSLKLHKFRTTKYYASLAGSDKSDPLRMQFIPDKRELIIHDYEKSDPLCESEYKVGRRIIRRYNDRVLFLITARCAMYCRHCFRRYLTGSDEDDVNNDDINELVNYLAVNLEIREVLLSGGDPLMLDNSRILFILNSIRAARPDIVIRIGSRIPVVLPSRIDAELIEALKKNRPVYLFTQFNHYRELAEESLKSINLFISAGIPVLNQTVLLRGINDNEKVLEKLFHKLVFAGIKPYYLFQGDLAEGTSHLRVSLKRGLDIMKNLSARMSGLSLPVFAVDLPGGGGKIRLNSESILSEENGFFKLMNYEGECFYYPDES